MTDLRDQLQAALGDTYVIQRELGGGGMSRVFVAREASLGRLVVVKLLPSDLAGSVSVARFRREITLAANLQHPHIVPLLSSGEVDGLPYFTMPFVEGESLRLRIARGELPVADTISILRDVARALDYAHGKGVAHRDIKPDNVLLSGTSAVITDFGVAKALSDATSTGSLTSVGIALGTPAYMAPEQAAADPATDFRADIYALGAMAYEMLAGHGPFAGRTAQGMLAAHATETPTSIDGLRPTAPAWLSVLVMRCLEKRPGDRPQTAGEIVQILDGATVAPGETRARGGPSATVSKTIGTAVGGKKRAIARLSIVAIVIAAISVSVWLRARAGAGGEIHSIAVLPFENTSRDAAFDYLEDGITDQVRDALNDVPRLTVKARGSSRQMKGRSPHEIGSRLDVGAVLQGTVSRSNSRLHVTVELVRSADDASMWSSTFDGQPAELAGMQDRIVRGILERLHLATADVGMRHGPNGARGTTDVEAYSSFLQGRYAFDRNDFGHASAFFSDAIARDQRFARAHAYLAMTYANSPTLGEASPDSMNVLARASAARALAIDSTIAEAYAAQSLAMVNDMDLAASIPPLERAAALDSNNADIISLLAAGLGQMGRVAEALVQAKRARQHDPLSGTAAGILSYEFELAGQYDSAIVAVKAARVLDPSNPIMLRGLGFYFAFAGKPDSAVAAFEAAFRLSPTLFGGRSNLIFGYAAAGRWADARRERTELEREGGGNSPYFHRMIAALSFGEFGAAAAALEQGVAEKEALFGIVSIACDPLFDPLKSQARFIALARRLDLKVCPAKAWPITRFVAPAG